MNKRYNKPDIIVSLMRLLVVIPAYNEEETLKRVLESVKKAAPSAGIVVVDDGSRDRTYEIALSEDAIVCRHLINRGLGASLATGITCALDEGADIIVTFDADLQHDAGDIKRLVKPIQEGRADAVIGSRFLNPDDLARMPLVKKLGNSFLTFFTNLLGNLSISDSQSGLRAFNRRAAERLIIICDRYEVSSEILMMLGRNDFRISEIPMKALYDARSIKKGTTIRSGIQIVLGLVMKKIGIKR